MYIKVKVKAGQKAESFEPLSPKASASQGKDADTFLASVKEKAERNMANKRIIFLTARHFKVPVGKVRIINGHQQPSKILSVDVD